MYSKVLGTYIPPATGKNVYPGQTGQRPGSRRWETSQKAAGVAGWVRRRAGHTPGQARRNERINIITLSVSRPGRGILFARHPCRGHPILGRVPLVPLPAFKAIGGLFFVRSASGWPRRPAPAFSTRHARGSLPRVARPAGLAADGGRGFLRTGGDWSD